MLDPRIEPPISLTEASKLKWLRTRRGRPNVKTLYRWASNGRMGIRLETITMGGARFTSEAALVRFFQGDEAPATKPAGDRVRAIAQAAAQLEAAGI